ncbi:MAG: glycosyltransferase family 4 protein [Phycisphaerales bacterium]|nr:glycosyltransferase family 4 protein [Phycisphaerales bacterium]
MAPSRPTRSVLIIEAGFLKSRHGKPVHGVELFRWYLIEQLIARGVQVTVYYDPAWRDLVRERFGTPDHCGTRGLHNRFTAPLGGTVSNAVHAIVDAKARGAGFGVVVFGNVCRGLIPAMQLAPTLRIGQRCMGFAHRRAAPNAVRCAKRLRMPIVAVSEHVAKRFREHGHDDATVYYGLPNADVFHPNETPREEDGLVHFVLLGRLPNVSKGMPKALAAWNLLRESVRDRCRLHLVAFIEPTPIAMPGVVAHTWTPAAEIPALLRSMDVMLALSSNETFSQAIVQGMLTGLPIVATSLPVYVEKLDTGGGIVADEPEAIAEAMQRLAKDASLRAQMGSAGRQTALERYVWRTDECIERFLFPHDGPAQ